MTRIISVLLLLLFSTVVLTARAADAPLELAPNAPKRHVVVRGDTLWGISAKFLKNPFRWNELWGLNKEQVKNPHWIYPGQVLVLGMRDGHPYLSIEGSGAAGGIPTVKLEPRVRISDEAQAIPAIPQQVIEPFLSQPLVADEFALEQTPRIVATQHDRVFSSEGDLAYVTRLTDPKQRLWQIYRPGNALIDPATQEIIGYEAMLLGTAQLVAAGEPATFRITSIKREVGKDDRLVPAPRPEIVNYPLHTPEAVVHSRVVSIYGDNAAGGGYSIVAIVGGKNNGFEVGHVLALARSSHVITDRYRDSKQEVVLPSEPYGLLYIFRTFDKVSYALVMNASQPVEVGDAVENP